MDKVKVFNEPLLDFGMGQQAPDPHNGLSLFGPYSVNENSHPAKINYSIIGTDHGLELATTFVERIKLPIINDDKDSNLWPHFPGYEVVFQTELPSTPLSKYKLKNKEIDAILEDKDPYQRTGKMVDLYLRGIKQIKAEDAQPKVILCVIPLKVLKSCRPSSDKMSPKKKETRKKQPDLFNSYDCNLYDYSVDFRRQLKAKSMSLGIPIQIILEPTLETKPLAENERSTVSPLSDRAWNLGTTLYYKAGGKPWRLSEVRDGVCYIGLSYKLTGSNKGSRSACCAAQMFLKDGDGIVFKGEEGKWYSPEEKTFHLTKEAAKKLLTGTIKSYESLGGKPLKEIFLHCHSSINQEEYEGFQEACPEGVKLIVIKVRTDNGVKLLRSGTRPVLRGTFWQINEKIGYLWGAGYKPLVKTYDGWEVPKPLKLEVLFGDVDVSVVARDVLALTKLNYNACKIGESNPVTIKFSEMVGEILISNPKSDPHPQFKFYI